MKSFIASALRRILARLEVSEPPLLDDARVEPQGCVHDGMQGYTLTMDIKRGRQTIGALQVLIYATGQGNAELIAKHLQKALIGR